MKQRGFVFLFATLLALFPLIAHADDGDKRGLLLRIDGDVEIARGQSVNSVIVISGNADIRGTVEDNLVVIDGTATIEGRVDGDVTVISGDLDLRSGATVKNVNLIRSDLRQAQGATISGDLNRRENFFFRGAPAVFGVLFWVAMTIGVIVAGLVFAAVGGRQLTTSAEALTARTLNTVFSALLLWIGVPIGAVLLILTLVGIPLGIGLLVFLLPAMWFFGYITAGTRLGSAISRLLGRAPGDRPYMAVSLGLLVLQLLVLVPVLGIVVAVLAGLWGAGALALVAFDAARGGGKGAAAAPVEQAAP